MQYSSFSITLLLFTNTAMHDAAFYLYFVINARILLSNCIHNFGQIITVLAANCFYNMLHLSMLLESNFEIFVFNIEHELLPAPLSRSSKETALP